jgi:hypothetical protein
MHHAVIHHDFPAEGVANALVAEANAENRHSLAGKGADNVVGHARLARRTRTGGHEDALRLQRADLLDGNFVIAPHLQVHAQLAQGTAQGCR